jgi:KTSC domain
MNRQSVTSSQIESIGYDQETLELEVEFKNGSVYTYENVPFDEYTSLMDADSVGKYFSANIKNKYKWTK